MIKIKRVYEKYEQSDGFRVLVDRLWPRGVSKQEAHVDLWLKEIAPSTNLREWFNHESEKWEEFKKRYKKELDKNKEKVDELKKIINENNNVTFVYSAKDSLHNQAVALKTFLSEGRQVI